MQTRWWVVETPRRWQGNEEDTEDPWMSRKSRCLFFWMLSSSLSLESNNFLLLLYLNRRMSNTLGASYPLERVRTILGQWFRPCVTPNPLVSAFLRPTPSSSCKRMRSLAGRERWRNTCVCIGQLAGILKPAALVSPAIEGISVRYGLYSLADEAAQFMNSSDITV